MLNFPHVSNLFNDLRHVGENLIEKSSTNIDPKELLKVGKILLNTTSQLERIFELFLKTYHNDNNQNEMMSNTNSSNYQTHISSPGIGSSDNHNIKNIDSNNNENDMEADMSFVDEPSNRLMELEDNYDSDYKHDDNNINKQSNNDNNRNHCEWEENGLQTSCMSSSPMLPLSLMYNSYSCPDIFKQKNIFIHDKNDNIVCVNDNNEKNNFILNQNKKRFEHHANNIHLKYSKSDPSKNITRLPTKRPINLKKTQSDNNNVKIDHRSSPPPSQLKTRLNLMKNQLSLHEIKEEEQFVDFQNKNISLYTSTTNNNATFIAKTTKANISSSIITPLNTLQSSSSTSFSRGFKHKNQKNNNNQSSNKVTTDVNSNVNVKNNGKLTTDKNNKNNSNTIKKKDDKINEILNQNIDGFVMTGLYDQYCNSSDDENNNDHDKIKNKDNVKNNHKIRTHDNRYYQKKDIEIKQAIQRKQSMPTLSTVDINNKMKNNKYFHKLRVYTGDQYNNEDDTHNRKYHVGSNSKISNNSNCNDVHKKHQKLNQIYKHKYNDNVGVDNDINDEVELSSAHSCSPQPSYSRSPSIDFQIAASSTSSN